MIRPDADAGEHFLLTQRARLNVDSVAAFVGRHDAFIRALAALPDGCFASLDQDLLTDHAAFFRACHLRYLTETELAASHEALTETGPSPEALLRRVFGENSGTWQRELARELDDSRVARVVMVGCGPLPATLLWLVDRYPDLHCVGLDTNAGALETAERLVRMLGASRLRLACIDGVDYDYATADLVYVANQTAPKRDVLERIAATIRRPATVIARDPYGNGWLLAEQVDGQLPRGYALRHTGGESPLFLSRDLVLDLEGA
ncbi:MAG: hypothetical protein KIT43_16475 [Bauldia sp.]|nr:hypothetical protein [Bauldia sp.]